MKRWVVALLAVFGAVSGAFAAESVFEPSSCQGPEMSRTRALSFFAPGTISADFARFTIHSRERMCHEVTGCAPWVEMAQPKLMLFYHRYTYDWLAQTEGQLRLNLSGRSIFLRFQSDPPRGSGSDYHHEYDGYCGGEIGSPVPRRACVVKKEPVNNYGSATLLDVAITDRCARFSTAVSVPRGDQTLERQTVIFATY